MVQGAEPAVARNLVFSQGAAQGGRDFVVGVLHGLEFLDQGLEAAVAVGVDVLHLFEHFFQIEGSVGRDLHFPADEVL